MRLTVVLIAVIVLGVAFNSVLFAAIMGPWYVDFFGPMAPAAITVSLLLALVGMPLYVGFRIVMSIKQSGQTPFVARTLAGVTLACQVLIGAGTLYFGPWSIEQLHADRGEWLLDWVQGAELSFEIDGGSQDPDLPPKWADEAPEPPPTVGGDPETERKELLALVGRCRTAGGAARYLDHPTAAGLGARWLAFALAQYGDSLAREPAQQARMTQLLTKWDLPVDAADWSDPAAFEPQLVADGRGFLLQVDQLAAEISEGHGDARELPPLVPWRDVVEADTRRPVRDGVVWHLHAGGFGDVVGRPLDADADYAAMYDGDDPETARAFLLQPDPDFSGPDGPVLEAFFSAARGDRGLFWKSPAYIHAWPDSLTHPAAGRAAACVIAAL